MKKVLLMAIASIMAVCAWGENLYDIIYTTDGKSIEAVIAEVSKAEVKYHEPLATDGPLFVISTDDIIAIHFSNGQVKTYKFGSAYKLPETATIKSNPVIVSHQEPKQSTAESNPVIVSHQEPKQSTVESNPVIVSHQYQQSEEHLARVQSFSGVLVFSKCTPIHDYQTLGMVSFSSNAQSSGFIYASRGVIVSSSSSSSVQYNEIRNGLIAQAVLANRETEGIIINGRTATMIKFNNDLSSSEKSLARPEIRTGVALFVDSYPIDNYEFVVRKKIAMAGGDLIDSIIDKLLKSFNKKEHIDGAIIHYVTGGYDNAEGIIFK